MTNDIIINQIIHFTFDIIQMILMRLLYLITIFAFQLMLINCKDDPKPEFFIDQDTKNFCVFTEGSWWLYEEENSAERDCVWVKQSFEKKIDSDDYGTIRNGYIIRMSSFFWQKQNVSLSLWAGGGTGDPQINRLEENINYPLALTDYTFYSSDTFQVFNPLSEYKIRMVQALDSYFINNTEYKDVRIFKASKGIHPLYQREIYWSKHIGKIRYERGDGSVWNLIEFNVTQ